MRIIPPPCQLSLLQCGLWPPPLRWGRQLSSAVNKCAEVRPALSDEVWIDRYHAWLYSDHLQTLFKRGHYLLQLINKNPRGPCSTGPWPGLHGISKYANLNVKKAKRVKWSQTSSNITNMSAEMRATVHTAQPSWNWIRWHWSARQTNSYRLHHFRSVSVSVWFRPGRRQNDIFLDKSITGARRRSLASPRPISGHGVCSYPGYWFRLVRLRTSLHALSH